MKKSAFTLIELLVVISIIAILAGIAMPVFTGVMEKGKATQDASNLRQIGIGLAAYLNDSEDTMIKGTATTWVLDDGTVQTLHPKYIPVFKVFQSPWDKRPASEELAKAPISYGFNQKILTPTGTASTWTGNMTTVKSSTSTVLMLNAYTGDPAVVTSWTGTPAVAKAVAAGAVGQTKGTHGSGKMAKVLYCDSHVDTIKFKDLQDTTTVKQLWDPLADAP
jgi:prepilin-type N-terminal cleavage/methylation domain-containing protein